MTNRGTKVCVAVRVRPLIERENFGASRSNWSTNQNVIQQIEPDTGEYVSNSIPYVFDHVFDRQTRTLDVYSQIVAPTVREALNGFNGTILCYGQTSSGKTYTLFGNDNEEGIISLAAEDLFKHISQDVSRTYIIRVGLVEIYNEKVTDLLNSGKQIDIKELNGIVVPKDLEEIEVLKPEDLLQAAKRVQQQRKIGETRMNTESSRSHTILRIFIESAARMAYSDGESDEVQVTNALLNFVDLAGSEKAGQTGAVGERFKEATFINKSLSVLSQVVMQLCDQSIAGSSSQGVNGNPSLNSTSLVASTSKPKSKFANFRDSKLTRILQSSLSGNAYIVMICNITPAQCSIDETHSTLRFAKTAKHIKTQPQANHNLTASAKYQQKIKELQSQLCGKATEVLDLKRQLGIYMSFCHNKRSLSSSDDISNPPADPKRRKTCCLGKLLVIKEESSNTNVNLDDSDLNSTLPVPCVKVLRSRASLYSPGDKLAGSDENFMSHSEALQHLRQLSEQKERVSWPDEEGLLTIEEFRSMKFDAQVQTDPMTPSSSPNSSRAKRQRQEGLVRTPVTALQLARENLSSALLEDKLEWQKQKEFLESDLAEKTNRIRELEAFIYDLPEVLDIRRLAEDLQIVLSIEMKDEETETDSFLSTSLPVIETTETSTETDKVLPTSMRDTEGQTTKLETIDAETSYLKIGTSDAMTITENLIFMVDANTSLSLPHIETRENFTETDKELPIATSDAGIEAMKLETVDAETSYLMNGTTDAMTATENINFMVDASTSLPVIETKDICTETDKELPISTRDVDVETMKLVTVDAETSYLRIEISDAMTVTEDPILMVDANTSLPIIETRENSTEMDRELLTSTKDAEVETMKLETVDAATSILRISTSDAMTVTEDLILMVDANTSLPVRETTETSTETDKEFPTSTKDAEVETMKLETVDAATSIREIGTRDAMTVTEDLILMVDANTSLPVIETTETSTETDKELPTSTRDTGVETIELKTFDAETSYLKIGTCDAMTVTENLIFMVDAYTSLPVTETKDTSSETDTEIETMKFTTVDAETSYLEIGTSDAMTTTEDPILMVDANTSLPVIETREISTETDKEFSTSTKDAEVETMKMETVDAETSILRIESSDAMTVTEDLILMVDVNTSLSVVETTETSTETDKELPTSTRDTGVETIELQTFDAETSYLKIGTCDAMTVTENLIFKVDAYTSLPVIETRDTSSETDTEVETMKFATVDAETSYLRIGTSNAMTATENFIFMVDANTSLPVIETSEISTETEIELPISTKDAEVGTMMLETYDAETSYLRIGTNDVMTVTENLIFMVDANTSLPATETSEVSTETEKEPPISTRDVEVGTMECKTVDAETSILRIGTSDAMTVTEDLIFMVDAYTSLPVVETRETSSETDTEVETMKSATVDAETSYLEIGTSDAMTVTENLILMVDANTSLPVIETSEFTTQTEKELTISTRDAQVETIKLETVDEETSILINGTRDVMTVTENLNFMIDAQTITETCRPIRVHTVGTATEELNVCEVKQVSRVNRGVQTLVDSDMKSHLRDLQIAVKFKERELSDFKDKARLETLGNRKQISDLESQLSSRVSEVDILKNKIGSIVSSSESTKTSLKRKVDCEIQCNYIIEQANRAITGERGLLPKGFPDIGDITREVKRLQQTNFVLDFKNKRCTCKGGFKDINTYINPLEKALPVKRPAIDAIRKPLTVADGDSSAPLVDRIVHFKQSIPTVAQEFQPTTSKCSKFIRSSDQTSSSSKSSSQSTPSSNQNQRYCDLIVPKEYKPLPSTSVSDVNFGVSSFFPSSAAPQTKTTTHSTIVKQTIGQVPGRNLSSSLEAKRNELPQQSRIECLVPLANTSDKPAFNDSDPWADELESLLAVTRSKKK